jgi:hypothetical protein
MQGHTTKRPVLTAIERLIEIEIGDVPGAIRSMPMSGVSGAEVRAALTGAVEPDAHLMTDGHKSFIDVGSGFAKHDTVIHSELEFARGIVHVNHAEGFNDRVRRTVVGVFHHISQKHVQLYFDEIGFRWRQRVFRGEVNRSTKSGRVVARKIWDRKSAGEQMRELLAGAVGREFRRTKDGGHRIVSDRSLFAVKTAPAAQASGGVSF